MNPATTTKLYQVKAFAVDNEVSIRTLHHYDYSGVLKPSGHTHSGYRLYTPEDAEKLAHIKFLKETGMPLEEIGRHVNSPDFDIAHHTDKMEAKIKRLQSLLRKVKKQ